MCANSGQDNKQVTNLFVVTASMKCTILIGPSQEEHNFALETFTFQPGKGGLAEIVVSIPIGFVNAKSADYRGKEDKRSCCIPLAKRNVQC